MKPKALILRTAGTNCETETAYAFELAGASCELMHVNRLLEDPTLLGNYQMLAVPGGFSYGDDIAAGRIFANQLHHHLHDPLHDFVAAGKPVLGICNGFQVLIKTDLLCAGGDSAQSCTLTNNTCGRFVDRWVHLTPKPSKCIWTEGLEPFELPIAHGEGRLAVADDSVRQSLWENGQVALVYTRPDGTPAKGQFPFNPNGSVDDIAGICDTSGVVFGLMPHPERHISVYQHYAWTSKTARGEGAGLKIFRNAVARSQLVGAGI